MATYHKPLLYKTVVVIALITYTLPVHAQLSANTNHKYTSGNLAYDHTSVTDDKSDSPTPLSSSTFNADAEVSINKAEDRKKLMGYLKQLTTTTATTEDVSYNLSRTKFLYHVANVFAKLKLYPLAMKCFLKTTTIRNKKNAEPAYMDTLRQVDSGYFAINTNDDSVVTKQAMLLKAPGYNDKKPSKATTYKYIVNTLNDGKKAVAYAMLFHVKQPVPGKRKIFVLGNTGHTFITLIKYNTDSTYTSFSFGFYPKKKNPLSATPVWPSTSSVFKDDTNHQWDEVLGKFISKRRFEKILSLVKEYDHVTYHLSNNNCTDFGIKAAALAGINIDETTGSWPLGNGDNPGVTGQSIIQGKFADTDSGDKDSLFVNAVKPADKQ